MLVKSNPEIHKKTVESSEEKGELHCYEKSFWSKQLKIAKEISNIQA